ncbi:MAG: radical SAM family heme chaperone HemW [Bacilli bacterium]
MRGVYIHIPFCKSICSYCDFCKFIYNSSWVNKYLSVLSNEIDEYYDNEEVKSIYIGGGTPSILDKNQLSTLGNIIKKFNLSSNIEFTFEINVNDITDELLSSLYSMGVNRLSIGVESFNNENLKYLNRKHTRKEISNNIKKCRSYGFDNISIDIIYALPNESISTVKKDIKEALRLKTEHISTYSLIIEDNTVLGVKKVKPIDEDTDAKMYNIVKRILRKNNYIHYEVSNFSKEGYSSIHNMIYWDNQEYYGFGLGASGYIDNIRYTNTRSFNSYLIGKYRKEELFISKRETMENEIMLGLRKIKGIDIKDFFLKYNINIQDEFNITDLIKEKLLVLDGSMLRISEDNIYIMNEIINMIIS